MLDTLVSLFIWISNYFFKIGFIFILFLFIYFYFLSFELGIATYPSFYDILKLSKYILHV